MESATPLYFLLVDDHAVVREGMTRVLQRRWRDATVGEASSLAQAHGMLADGPPPDLVLLDLHLPEPDAVAVPSASAGGTSALLENLRRLRHAQPLVPVLVVSGLTEPGLALSCLQLGASGYLAKSADSAVVVHAIELVLDGGMYLPPFLAGVPAAAPVRQPALTARQRDVLRCLVKGMANKEIARALDLAEPTVKAHLVTIFRALEVKNRAQAVLVGRDLLAGSHGDA